MRSKGTPDTAWCHRGTSSHRAACTPELSGNLLEGQLLLCFFAVVKDPVGEGDVCRFDFPDARGTFDHLPHDILCRLNGGIPGGKGSAAAPCDIVVAHAGGIRYDGAHFLGLQAQYL